MFQCCVELCTQVCVGNKMHVFLVRERDYYDEQLALNDRLCPAAVINHAHCPLQPPSLRTTLTRGHRLQLRQVGRDKQNPGPTNPPINTGTTLTVTLRQRARRSKSSEIRGNPLSLLLSSSSSSYQCVCPSCGSKRRRSRGLCPSPWDP